MTYENTVRNALLTYGLVMPSEWHVAEHLFCCIGNGYEWKGGQIVSESYNKKKQILTMRQMIKNDIPSGHDYQKLYSFANDYASGEFDKNAKKIEASMLLSSMRRDLIKNQSAIINYELGNYFVPNFLVDMKLPTVYPTCEYSLINNIPENIKPDWVVGIVRFVSFCLDNPFLIKEENTKKDLERVMDDIKKNHIKDILKFFRIR